MQHGHPTLSNRKHIKAGVQDEELVEILPPNYLTKVGDGPNRHEMDIGQISSPKFVVTATNTVTGKRCDSVNIANQEDQRQV